MTDHAILIADEEVVNLPNAISALRISLAPVLLYLALAGKPNAFLAMLVCTEITDILDGFLARKLHKVTTMGSHLDSVGDFIIYSVMALSAWLLWPVILEREFTWFMVILLSFLVPALAGLIKYRRLTGYHTWSVKLAVLVTVVSYLLLFSGMEEWPLRVAALLCVYAAFEEVAITLVSREEHVDVRSLWHTLNSVRQAGN